MISCRRSWRHAQGFSLRRVQDFPWLENTRSRAVGAVSSLRDEIALPWVLFGKMILEKSSMCFRVLFVFLSVIVEFQTCCRQ